MKKISYTLSERPVRVVKVENIKFSQGINNLMHQIQLDCLKKFIEWKSSSNNTTEASSSTE